jgi:hypothetical protein
MIYLAVAKPHRKSLGRTALAMMTLNEHRTDERLIFPNVKGIP